MENKNREETFCVLAYLGNIFFLPLFILPLTKKDSDFCKFNAKQSIILYFSVIVFYMLKWFVEQYVFSLSTTAGAIFGWFTTVMIILSYTLSVMGLLNAQKNLKKKLPIVGRFVK